MTDHDAIDDTPRFTAAEASALAVLDRRGRAAAVALTASLTAPSGTTGSTTPSGQADDLPLVVDLPLTVDLRRERRSRRLRRAGWLAAAAVIAVVGLVATFSLRGDGRLTVMSGDEEEQVDPDGGRPLPLGEGQTEVAVGVHGGEPWQLRWTRRPHETRLELWWRNGSASIGWSDGDGGSPPLPLEVTSTRSAAWPVAPLLGTAPDGATVTVEVLAEPVETEPVDTEPVDTEPVDTEPVDTEMVELPNGREGFVAFLPAEVRGEALVVARDAAGREVGRDSVRLVPWEDLG